MQKIKLLHLAVLATLIATSAEAALDKDAVAALESAGTPKVATQAQSGNIGAGVGGNVSAVKPLELSGVKPITGAPNLPDDKKLEDVKKGNSESTKEFNKGSIGSLAEKQKKLYELEIESKIKEAENKLKPSPAAQTGVNSPILPAGLVPPSPVVVKKKKPTKAAMFPAPAVMEDPAPSVEVSSIYGSEGSLIAEFTMNGSPIVGAKNDMVTNGWIISDIKNNEIVLTRGDKVFKKKLNLVEIKKQAPSNNMDFNSNNFAATPLPPLPVIQDATSYQLPKVNATKGFN